MAPAEKDDDLGDVYELLGIDEEADDKEIQAAYRKGSLKVHPDRNPDDPEAAQKFDRLTRAKDLLLDPVRRGALDRQKRAKRELQERYAEEDEKRRRLREDLESREGAASRHVPTAQEKENVRWRQVQTDWSTRLRKRESELVAKQMQIIREASDARFSAEEARVKLSWKKRSSAPSTSDIRKALAAFSVKSIEMGESAGIVQLGSREDAIRAVLHCRSMKHQLPFQISLLLSEAEGIQAPEPDYCPAPSSKAPTASEFPAWEASVLAELWKMANAAAAKAG